MKLVIATKNRNKIREIHDKFKDIPELELLDIGSYHDMPDVEETGDTFLENAMLKADALCRFTGVAAMADDSGLVVDALDGRPGVLSARYGGPGLTDHDRNLLLLQELQGVRPEQRRARFICSIAVVLPGGKNFSTEGCCEGAIADRPRGREGFGYDPVFVLPHRGRTMAELSLDEKNRISHRALALDKAACLLKELHDQGYF